MNSIAGVLEITDALTVAVAVLIIFTVSVAISIAERQMIVDVVKYADIRAYAATFVIFYTAADFVRIGCARGVRAFAGAVINALALMTGALFTTFEVIAVVRARAVVVALIIALALMSGTLVATFEVFAIVRVITLVRAVEVALTYAVARIIATN